MRHRPGSCRVVRHGELIPTRADVDQFLPPDRVRMLPVILVAADQKPPTQNETRAWIRHLKWSQEFFHKRLSERDTFEFAKTVPDVVRLKRPLSYYKSLGKAQPALHWTAELLDHYSVSRFQCPYTFCCLVMNAACRRLRLRHDNVALRDGLQPKPPNERISGLLNATRVHSRGCQSPVSGAARLSETEVLSRTRPARSI